MPSRSARLLVCLAVLTVAAHAQEPAPEYSQEAFVIATSDVRYRFEDDGTGHREAVARIRIQSEAGVQQWGQLVLGYNAATERLDIEYVRVRKSDGAIVTAPETAVQEIAPQIQLEAPVYTDFRQKHVTVPALRPGETLEFATRTTIHTPLAAGHYWLEHDFERQMVVLEERLEVDVPAARALIVRTGPGTEAVVEDRGGRRVYRWSSRQLSPTANLLTGEIAGGDGGGEEADRPPSVRLTSFRDWGEVGAWYAALERAARTPTPDVRAKALELTAGATTDMEKLQALYEYVSPNFRYVSISLGMGRYQPRPATDVLRDQYGDCKDKHTLLASLLESVGLEASTVLIDSARTLDPEFPSPSQFDHVITRAEIGGEPVWMDVTTEVAPFRMLSAGLRDKQALVVSRSARLEETPADPPFANEVAQEVDGTLSATGALAARVQVAMRGDLELLLRLVFRSTPEPLWGELVDALNGDWAVDGTVRNWQVSDPASTREPFSVAYDLEVPRFAVATGRPARVSLPVTDMSLPEHGSTMPLDVGSPMTFRSRLRLELEEGYTARAPVDVTVERDYGDYRGSYQLAGRVLTAERRLRTMTRSIPADRAADYMAFRKVIEADAAQQLALELSAAPAPPAVPAGMDDLLRSGIDAIRGGRSDQAIADLQQLVAREPRHQSAWTILGLALRSQRRQDEAIAALEQATAVNPYDAIAHRSLAEFYVDLGRYEDAERAIRRQLEVNPLDAQTTARLGAHYVRMERADEAIAQYERAATLDPDNALLHAQRGEAYLHADRVNEALAAFDRAVALSPAPVTWNNVAFYLAEKGVHLDRAQQYAESAVASIAAESRNLTIDRTTARDMGIVHAMASYWDTLGWVLFAKGDYSGAERFVAAAWRLSQTAVVGDHLARIHEKQGRRDLAIRSYAAALSAGRPEPGVGERLGALAGVPAIDELVQRHSADLVTQRTVPVRGVGASGTAEFYVLLGAAGAEAAAFISGDEALRDAHAALRAAEYGPVLPDETPARVLRRGVLACPTGTAACDFILYRSGEALSSIAMP